MARFVEVRGACVQRLKEFLRTCRPVNTSVPLLIKRKKVGLREHTLGGKSGQDARPGDGLFLQ